MKKLYFTLEFPDSGHVLSINGCAPIYTLHEATTIASVMHEDHGVKLRVCRKTAKELGRAPHITIEAMPASAGCVSLAYGKHLERLKAEEDRINELEMWGGSRP